MTHEERRVRRENICKDLLAGMQPAAVAKKYGIGNSHVYRLALSCGVSSPRIAHICSLRALKLLLDGQSQASVANTLQVSRQRINQVATRTRKAGFILPGDATPGEAVS